MRDLSLSNEIKGYFPNQSEAVVKNLLIVSWRIYEARSTNLIKAKDYVPGILGTADRVEEHSNYMRLIRFFKTSHSEELVSCILTVCCLFLMPGRAGNRASKYLLLDGTKWQHGKQTF